MSANLENSAVATGLEKVSFHSNPKEKQCQRMLKLLHKIALISYALCDPMGYTVHGILQARILEWIAFPFSRGSSQPRDRTQVPHIAGNFFTSWGTGEAQECSNDYTIPLISHTSKVMLKILQVRLQQYVNRELPDVQAGFRGTRNQIANVHGIIKKAREFQKNIYFCFIDYAKTIDCVDHNKLENS